MSLSIGLLNVLLTRSNMQVLTIIAMILAISVSMILEIFVLSFYTSNPFTLIMYWSIHALLVMIVAEILIGLFAKRKNLANTKEVFKMIKSAHQKQSSMTLHILMSGLCLIISYGFLNRNLTMATNIALVSCIVLFFGYVFRLIKLENK